MQQVKSAMLPLAMLLGAFFYEFFQELAFLSPYLIFCMLFITYCRLSFRDLHFSRLHIVLLVVQLAGSLAVYGALCRLDPVLAQGGMICVLAPTATAGAVVTGMLGGSVACLAAYTLISSLVMALVAPLLFTLIGGHSGLDFWTSVWLICRQVMPVLVLPALLAFGAERWLPAVHCQLKRLQVISFYLWAFALTIVTGKTVSFIVRQEGENVTEEWWMASLALVVCVAQFLVGRRIGRRYGDAISGGQGLGQKNTILAIWMAQVYLNPLSSIAPASYVLWQNIINSWQLWLKERRAGKPV